MCWEIDYHYFEEQRRLEQARLKQEQRAGVIDKLLGDANKPGEAPKVDETPVKEIAPAK